MPSLIRSKYLDNEKLAITTGKIRNTKFPPYDRAMIIVVKEIADHESTANLDKLNTGKLPNKVFVTDFASPCFIVNSESCNSSRVSRSFCKRAATW